jgi:hypothetical protein
MMTSHPTIRLKIMYVRCECVGVCLCMCGLPSMCRCVFVHVWFTKHVLLLTSHAQDGETPKS